MKDPFISANTLLVGAAIFAILMSAAVIYGSFMPATQTTGANSSSNVPITAHKTAHATVTATTTLPQATSTKSEMSISFSPAQIIQGDPVLITLTASAGSAAAADITDIKSAELTAPGPNSSGGSRTTALNFIQYAGKTIAFYGTGINQAIGRTTVTVIMKDGSKVTGSFTIGQRNSPTESLAVPEQLGGNSTSSQENLVSELDTENAELASVYSNPDTMFWSGAFSWPIHAGDISAGASGVGGIVVTDPFGYERDSGAATIIHKGTDFKAPPGTPVYAINTGYVRVSQLFSVYGNTIIVDHGMGIESFYMHLSSMIVKPGDAVTKGQLIGYSGETGYSEGPHLHLTIRVGGVSIDPMVFYGFFGLKPDAVAM